MILGIDTSCYTTSLAVVNSEGQLIQDDRQLLSVPEGERGLQQSAALFQHVQHLPVLFEQLADQVSMKKIQGVAASVTPRPVLGSYMPVFTMSSGLGKIISRTLNVPYVSVSHQEGHIMAGLWSAGGPVKDTFIAVHLSGGTSEVCRVERHEHGFGIEILGATTDLHAGQFVDRIGVLMGLPFPSGKHLEQLATKFTGTIPFIPTAVQNYDFSFSGPESAAQRMVEQGIEKSAVARAVEHCISTTLEKVLRKVIENYLIKDVLIVGGVAANTYLRNRLRHRLEHRAVGAKLFFAEPRYSTDNAVGTALLGLKALQSSMSFGK